MDLRHLIQQSLQFLTIAPNLVSELLQRPELRNPVAVSFGAIAGALSRYYLSLWFAQRFGTNFPYGTFFINLTGCFAMGFFVTLAFESVATIPPEVRLLVAVGFLGSYTTFSTYGLDTITLLHNHTFLEAGIYWAGSAIIGIICLQLGIIMARLGK